jgi:hypothetical protein
MKPKIQLIPIIFLAITTIGLLSCDPADSLKIINNSNSNIYVFISCDSSLNDLKFFRNGYYYNSIGEKSYITSNEFIKSKSFDNIPKRGFNAWASYIRNCPNQNINIYFFTDSTVVKYSNYEIKELNLFEKHINLTLRDLKKCDWTIKFP